MSFHQKLFLSDFFTKSFIKPVLELLFAFAMMPQKCVLASQLVSQDTYQS